MAKIFLSYRRQDSAAMAGRIYDRLRLHFGNDAVFMDIDNIPFGVNFRKHIDAAVGQCDLFLAVIGTKWAGEADDQRRIDDPKDFVRIEIESALKREIPVIPILIDRTRMPSEADLPPSLALLADYNATEVDQGRDFHPHVDRLIKGIEFHLEGAGTAAVGHSDRPQEEAASSSVPQELVLAPPPQHRSQESGSHVSASAYGAPKAVDQPPANREAALADEGRAYEPTYVASSRDWSKPGSTRTLAILHLVVGILLFLFLGFSCIQNFYSPLFARYHTVWFETFLILQPVGGAIQATGGYG